MESLSQRVLYIDTNVLRGMGHVGQYYLWQLVRDKQIKICLSNYVVYELARQRYQGHYETSDVGAAGLLQDEARGQFIEATIKQYSYSLKAAGIDIVENVEFARAAQLIDQHKDRYFQGEQGNDGRDALIACGAIDNLNPDQTVIICREVDKLDKLLKEYGFIVLPSIDPILAELGLSLPGKEANLQSGFVRMDDVVLQTYALPQSMSATLEIVDPAYHRYLKAYKSSIPQGRKALDDKLHDLGQADDNIRVRLLGFTYAFGPVAKSFVIENANSNAHETHVESSLLRILDDGLIIQVQDNLLPNPDNPESRIVGAQAMNVIMSDIIKAGGLSE